MSCARFALTLVLLPVAFLATLALCIKSWGAVMIIAMLFLCLIVYTLIFFVLVKINNGYSHKKYNPLAIGFILLLIIFDSPLIAFTFFVSSSRFYTEPDPVDYALIGVHYALHLVAALLLALDGCGGKPEEKLIETKAKRRHRLSSHYKSYQEDDFAPVEKQRPSLGKSAKLQPVSERKAHSPSAGSQEAARLEAGLTPGPQTHQVETAMDPTLPEMSTMTLQSRDAASVADIDLEAGSISNQPRFESNTDDQTSRTFVLDGLSLPAMGGEMAVDVGDLQDDKANKAEDNAYINAGETPAVPPPASSYVNAGFVSESEDDLSQASAQHSPPASAPGSAPGSVPSSAPPSAAATPKMGRWGAMEDLALPGDDAGQSEDDLPPPAESDGVTDDVSEDSVEEFPAPPDFLTAPSDPVSTVPSAESQSSPEQNDNVNDDQSTSVDIDNQIEEPKVGTEHDTNIADEAALASLDDALCSSSEDEATVQHNATHETIVNDQTLSEKPDEGAQSVDVFLSGLDGSVTRL